MTTEALISHLSRLDVRLWIEDDRLRYSAPQGVMAPELRAQLVRRKEEIIAFLHAAREAVDSPVPALEAVPRGRELPLSFSQQRLWFIDRLMPESPAYNLFGGYRLRGAIDVRALGRAFDEIVRRHETLRTTFAAEGEDPRQVIARPQSSALPQSSLLPRVDLEALPAVRREQEARRLAAAEGRRPFDLVRGPLLRTVLMRLTAAEHVLHANVHHIVSDGWSSGILFHELVTLYEAFAAAEPSPLPELPIQYADFALWQRRWLRGETLHKQLDYWQRQLAGAPELLDLPFDHPRPAIDTAVAHTVELDLPAARVAELRDLGRQRGATASMTLLAAWKTLLYRVSGQSDVLVGMAVANRNRSEVEDLIGFFVNTLVLRSELADELRFCELLDRVRETALGAYAHQDLPFEKLVEELRLERRLDRNPLCQVMFGYQNFPRLRVEVRDVEISAVGDVRQDTGTSKFDLTLLMDEVDEALTGLLEYNSGLFEATTIRRLLGHFTTLLAGVTAAPERRLADLPLLSPSERHQLAAEWTDTATPYPARASIPELFEAQARRTPEAVAMVLSASGAMVLSASGAVALSASGAAAEQVSYRELNARANRLAHHLRDAGVGREVCVGLCLERSVEMVVALLGILKAGGAYVPLDPSYPAERLAFMLEDLRAPVLVCRDRLPERLAAAAARAGEPRIVRLADEGPAVARRSAENPDPGTTPENLAYVMFTSGSTGRPKGVSVPHRGVVRLVRETGYAELDDRQVWLQFAPVSFDAATLELWGPLLNGGRLVVFPPHTPSLQELGAVLERHAVTALWLTAGLFHQMVDDHLPGLRSVRQLLAGGDVLSARHLRRVLEKLPACTVVNGYGPTENTTFTCCSPMRAPGEVDDSVSIGRPIANTRVAVLDRRLRPVGAGIFGELLIGGHGLARGYLNRPQLTAASFIPHPGAEHPGERLYRSGDVVRWLADGGRLEFLGRRDAQVKLRGFRIELGEVESVLTSHPGVRQAVVILREGQLVAYAVPAVPGSEIDPGALRSFLAESLPDYMVPAAVVGIDALPLTPNGKVDRPALARRELPALRAGAAAAVRAQPRTPIEEALAAIWAEVLGRDEVGVHDDFFELGGHSLLATRVVSQVRRRLRVELGLRALFEQPTVAGLAGEVTAALRREQGLEAPPIRPVPRRGPLPLSFAQERLWFIDRFEPGSALYNIPSVLHLRGELDAGALARALAEIVRRHEMLRTSFGTEGGMPVQRIRTALELEMPVLALDRPQEPQCRAEIRRLALSQARQPFDLTRAPLLRTLLLRCGPQQHSLVLTVHHIAFDGWSVGVFLNELVTLYQAFSTGSPSPLPEPEVQYADFAVWQRRWLAGEVLDRQLGYWREQLAALPVLELPTDRPRPVVQSFRGAEETLRLPGERLNALSRERGTTLYMTLLAVFQLLLERYTGQRDLAVGSVVANRNRAETEALVGFFVNTLVLRGDLRGNPTFLRHLARVRDVALEAYAHQDVPFEKLVEELAPQRDLSQNPLVQVLLVLQDAPAAARELVPGLSGRLEGVATGEAKFDLTLLVWEEDGALRATAEYGTDLFDAVTVRRLLGHFRTLLDAAAADPERRCSQLPMLSAAERHALILEWNDTRSAYPRETSIARLFELRVERAPAAVAIVWRGPGLNDVYLSYGELNRRANRLAHHLRALGVGRGAGGSEALVGIYLERTVATVVATLAILKAGGAYLPLDLSYPAERLAFMLGDAAAPVLVTDQALAATLPPEIAALGLEVVAIDRDAGAIARRSAANPDPGAVLGENLAYVIYTSGSTGVPKGVAVTHRGIARLVLDTNYIDPGPGDRMVQASNTSFDAATFELWGALLVGGQLHGIPKEVAIEPRRLAAAIREQGITVLFLTTALHNQMAREEPAAFATLRYLFFGGELVDPRWVREALIRGGPGRLLHVYGPTESTTYASWYPVWEVAEDASTVPIGGAVGNSEIYVVDRALAPVPVRVAGELAIGGDGLARGYLNRPERTAECFVPNPLSGDPFTPGGRLYRTGDLVRRLPDGAVEFLGRLDHQVKLRGFRIELGEVEALLSRHPGVREVVVTVWEEQGDRRLVAYVVRAPQAADLDAGALRAYLAQTLPDYMVPSAMVFLAALPLTPNGKVDRRALPAPEPAAGVAADAAGQGPRDPLEELVAGIWSELLGVDPVGIHDDFFALGGHSLLATQLTSRLRETLGLELPLRAVFEHPTVAALAACANAALRGAEGLVAPPLRPVARQLPAPLSFAQQRLWFLDRLDPGSAVYNIPIALRLRGRLEVTALTRALDEIVRRHEVLRTRFETVDGEPVQVIRPRFALALPIVDLDALGEPQRGGEARRLLASQARRPFDLARGPVLRAVLLRLGRSGVPEGEHTLFVSVHHVAFDGWSGGVFLRELAVLYQAHASGRTPELPELPVQYADFAVWQRRWLRGEALERQLAYWREQLKGLGIVELPCDRPRPAVQSFRGTSQPVLLPAELARRLQELSRQQETTRFMTLLAAFQTLVGRITGQTDLAVGTAIANRNRAEIEPLVGFFVNTLVLRADLSGPQGQSPTFRELLERVRDTALGAFAHQDVPFEQLVEELDPQRDLSHNPLVQVHFVLQNMPMPHRELAPELAVEIEDVATGVVKFDLMLGFMEAEEGLAGSLEYGTDLFDASTIRRLARQFETLLEGAVADPERRLGELPLLTPAERHALVCEWRSIPASELGAGRLIEHFEATAARRPEAIAVVSPSGYLSYGELNARANRLAGHLRGLGVGPEVIVGLFLERSPEVLAAIVGVLKAGGAYLPLDPAYPRDRLAYMLDDAGAAVVLTRDRLAPELPETRAAVVRLDADAATIAAHSRENLGSPGRAENLVYVIYTSGSTGRPKGVMLGDRGLCGLVAGQFDFYDLGPRSRVIQFSSLSFDASVYEIFSTLVGGGTLCLGSAEELMPGPELSRYLRRHEVTTWTVVPSALAAMPDEPLPALVSLTVAGEACTPELVERWAAGRRFVNAYGPTENTVCASAGQVRGHRRNPPIGRPFAASRLHVVDRRCELVPAGVPGELLIGGIGLARGYLGRPELTAERFIPDPWSNEPERLYRSGDLVRFLADGGGRLEFLGRIDQQVKLRGFRIELGEVEAALAAHPAVREAVAIVRGQRLVAYVVAAGEAVDANEAADASELRAWVGESLPEYMVPAAVVGLEALPLSPSGKVDRRALPAPEPAGERAGPWTAPRGPVEEILAETYSQLLGVERVGADDDFFALGGHSLLATQVVSRVRRSLGVELPLRVVFEQSTVAGLAAAVGAALRREEGPEAPPIRPLERREAVPLSFAQQRLWFLDRLEPVSSLYNIPTALHLVGRLDPAALVGSLNAVVRRHEVLRTTYAEADDGAVQVIRPAAELPLPVVDLGRLRESERGDEARRLSRSEARRPFDMARGPVLRAVLVRLDPAEHHLLLTVHHIAFDGWSAGVFLDELAARYRGEPELPELRVQYGDFAVWQRQWLRGEVLERQLGYWREQLAGLPVLDLPCDRPRPAVQSFRGTSEPLRLPAEVGRGLRALSREHGATLFMTLVAAFQALLGRTSGQTDLAVGTPIAGRTQAELEGLLGFFVNTLVLRGDLKDGRNGRNGQDGQGELTFDEIVGRARETALGAYAHQEVPFESLVEELDPERDLSQNPLAQVLFLLQHAPAGAADFGPELEVGIEDVATGEAKFDLTLALVDGGDELTGALEYNVDLFDRTTILRLLGSWHSLLEAAAADPQRRLCELPLVSAAQRQQLVREWNDTRSARTDPQTVTLHQLIEAQVEKAPEAVAVEFDAERLSYRELNRRANQLAHHLRRLVGPEEPVGICAERSAELVVGLLGILKAGGAYLPLDPTYPPERLSFMAEASGLRVLLTQERLLPTLPALADRVVCLDTGGAEIRAQSAENPSPAAASSNLAYVIYTSGSTGQPKGSMIPHRGIVNRLRWMQEAYGLEPGEGVLQKTPFSFDVSVWEFFWPLLEGARLVVARPGGHQDSAYLAAVVAERAITTMHFVPSMLQAFVEEPRAEGCVGLRRVIASGEALPHALQERFFACLDAELHNLYGPTEAAVDVTFWACERSSERASVPIGRPIANTEIYLLDREGRPAPLGVAGELHIGGVGLARGYLGRPDLTAERFVPDPLSGDPWIPGGRLYRTGDLARFRPEGAIEFLGRIDFQIKIRGFRIELGEIEAALGRSPRVRECVVVAREHAPGDYRLVAYAVADGEVSEQELRAALRESLPEYMVPAAVVLLDALPLNPNGKVDRKALPEPSRPSRPSRPSPEEPIEAILVETFSELLGIEGIGADDDFFALGGHSLLATRMISRVRRTLGVELPLRLVFQAPTPAALAVRVGAALRREEGLEAPPIRRVEPRDQPLPLSFAQQRLWFIDRFEPGTALYNIPTLLRLEGRLEVAALHAALIAIVRRHEVLRTRFAAGDGEPVQVIGSETLVPLPVVELAALPAAARRTVARGLAAHETRRPFDLTRGPLLRAALLRLGPQQHLFAVTVHHIAFDGWSGGVFLSELAALYGAFSAPGPASPPAELEVQYADFAVWQRQWLTGEVLERQLAYWREQLRGLPVLELPCDRPRPVMQSFRGAAESFRLPSAGLNALSRGQGTTLFMTLLAVFQALLYRHTGQEDLAVGSVVAHRNRAEIEPLLGFFVNTLVLRGDLRGGPAARELLARVRDVALGAYAHQDVPFERLVEELDPERDLSQNPLVQVVFVLQNAPSAPRDLVPGLTATIENLATREAKFDLTVVLWESQGELWGTAEYGTDLLDASTVRRLMGHFRCLAEGMAAEPGRRLSELRLMSAGERWQLLGEWNETAGPGPAAATIPELFAAQLGRTPDAVAVVGAGRQLSYAELDRRANRLAHRLRAAGVGPEVPVAIATERSPEMVVGVLAILKAGGAYLPLDPDYPPERRAFMVRDAGVAVVLTRERLRAEFAEVPEVIGLDGLGEGSESAPAIRVGPENLAYVIYTSGSTGLPKGTELAHRGLVNLVAWHQRLYAVSAADRATQLAAPGFDAAVWELWPYLTAGAAIHIPEREVVADPARLPEWLARSGISLSFLPTPLAEAVLAQPLPARLRLRALLTGGDRLHQHPDRDLPFALVNHYGPTENTVVTTAGAVAAAQRAGPPSIGRPIAHHRVHLLDRALRPVPIGVAGELYAAGTGLARGYLGRPGLTAEKFIPSPFAAEPGGRLYRTGDLARYLGDGRIDFLGRIDHQVKLRGFRIELGEIETVLGRHPGVREAAVVVRDGGGDRRLVAYVAGAEASASELRSWLGETLPEYMVPSALVYLDALPLTAHGKVDRRALPAPAPEAEVPAGAGAGPRGPIEEIVAGIWSQVLRRQGVGVDDDFFELGGHSLLATQVQSRVRRELGVELPLRVVFEQPTVAGLASWIGVALGREEGLEAPPIRPVERDAPLPLSFAQQRLWFLDRLEPGAAIYAIPTSLAFTGRLHRRALDRALGEIVRRHEVLRTRFALVDGNPIQEIQSELELRLPLVDLSALGEPPRRIEARRLVSAAARRPFDLARGPLLRAVLLRRAGDEHMLLLSVHHIAFDGWSAGVFLDELSVLYRAYSTAQSSPLPELRVQYADFAVWQRQWLVGEVLDRQLGYWREQLAGLPVLDLPTDRPRPAVQSYLGTSEPFLLPAELHGRLRALSRECGTTLFMTLLAAFQVLLGRITGEVDLAVGTPIAGRNRAELEGLLGFFVNTLVLRAKFAPDCPGIEQGQGVPVAEGGGISNHHHHPDDLMQALPLPPLGQAPLSQGELTFREFLGRVRETALGAYAHQDVPFESLVEALDPERHLSRNPLVQVLFLLQNAPDGAADFGPELEVGIEGAATGEAKFDLTLGLMEGEDGLRGGLEYNVDLFDRTTILRLLGCWRRLLEAVASAPERRLFDLPLVSAAQRQQLVREWNDTRSPRTDPPAVTLHQLIEAQVEATPEAVAVEFADQRLSYRELNRRANQLAHHLRGLGVREEVRVGICAERSSELVVGLLGILKAGGAYLPLDPTYPPERLSFMAEASGVGVLLTQERWLPALPALADRAVCLDAGRAEISARSAANPAPAASSSSLAYVIYTSGSTGQPKGSMIPHRGIVNRLRWMQEAYGLRPGEGVLQKTPFSFDVSVWEFFWPLMVGARLVVARPGGHQESVYLAELVAERAVTTMHFVPSMLQVFVEEPRIAACVGLRRVIASGEALPPALKERFFARLGAELHNLYGPTEASVDVTFWACERGGEGSGVPIGRPIANTEIHLLDRVGNPVPVGAAGELHIGGVGLARGYLGRPDLTAERFVPDPLGDDRRPGARLYRTGDLARFRPDGAIEFLGRLDHQLKLRGFRIELGEIEAVLHRSAGVRECVVVARERGAGDLHLVAYAVAEAPATDEGLRADLGDSLPEYMVPSAIVFLDSLPLTPNGKIDRRALPEPAGLPELAATRLAPRDTLELRLAQIWEEILDVRPVGVRDDFFALGGHSLQAVRLLARIEQELGRELPLTALFRGPTVEQLAGLLRSGAEPGASCLVAIRPTEAVAIRSTEAVAIRPTEAVAIRPTGSKPPLFCVHPAGGNVLSFVPLAQELDPEQPFYALQSRGLEGDGREPLATIEEMAAQYVAELREVEPQGPYQLAGWSFGGLVAYEMACRLRDDGFEVTALVLFDTVAPAAALGSEVAAPFDDDAFWLADIGHFLARLSGRELPLSYDELRQLAPEEQVGFFVERLREIDFLPPATGVAQVRRLLRVYKTNIRASWEFEPRPYDGVVTLFRAAEGLANDAAESRTADLGWGGHTCVPVEVTIVPGDHITMLARENLPVLAERLGACLEKRASRANRS